MKDVFISYASEDRQVAQTLAAGLDQAGVTVWWDRQIQVGSEWDKTIEDALAAARCVIVLWTDHAKHSRWVRAEAREALAQEKIVPVMMAAHAIPLAFTGIQSLKFLEWDGSAGTPEFAILLDVIRAKLSGQAIQLPETSSTKPSLFGKLISLLGLKVILGGGAALLLIASSLIRIDPVMSVHVQTARMEFRVIPETGNIRLMDHQSFDALTFQHVGKLSVNPDRLLVADPAEYDMDSDSYPPKAWQDVEVDGKTVTFVADRPSISPDITLEMTEHKEAVVGQLDSIVLTDEAVVSMEVSPDNAVTWSIRTTQGRQRVVMSRIHAVQLIQSGLKATPGLSIPFPQDQELTYQVIFEHKPGTIELFGQDEALVMVLQEKSDNTNDSGDPQQKAVTKKLIAHSVLPIQDVDFSWQDPGTGERRIPEGFRGTVDYVSPQGIPGVMIGENEFLTVEDLAHFEITSMSVDPNSHQLVVDLKGEAGYVKAGTAGNPQDLRPTVFDAIRYSPLFEPVRTLIGLS
ncbi:MAG: toll/interleukin-1 receptor domain-containing protein [Nitrospira sp.]|nr:toll/interleukin-1 receptor domain-containing protein [Nitrospira sp.]